MVDPDMPSVDEATSKDGLGPSSAVWAKLSRYPWWPALIVGRNDARIPAAERKNHKNSKNSTPVLFFGTADFAWIDAARNVSPWIVEYHMRRTRDKTLDFKQAVLEADTYVATGQLPQAFITDAYDQEPSPAPNSSAHVYESPMTHSVSAPYPLLSADELQDDVSQQRRLLVQRRLGLRAPFNSPAATQGVPNHHLLTLVQ